MFNPKLFEGHVALITGGGSGLGKAVAQHLVRYGGKVALVGRREKLLQETVQELGEDKAMAIRCDVRFADEVDNALEKALERFGHIDALVNSAAGNFVAPTERLTPNAFKIIIDTVLMGTVHFTLAFGKHCIAKQQRCTVLSVVTNYASTGSAFVVPSGCAKAGVENLTKSLAAEWGHYGLRFLAISPGPFPTEGAMGQLRIYDDLLPGQDIPHLITERIPLGRMGKLEEFGDLAAFLLSPNAEYITGEIIRIDGGEIPSLSGEFNFMRHVPQSVWDQDGGRLNHRKRRENTPT